MASNRKQALRQKHPGVKILQRAQETIFPLPEQPDPAEIGGLLMGFVTALRAVGYRLPPAQDPKP